MGCILEPGDIMGGITKLFFGRLGDRTQRSLKRRTMRAALALLPAVVLGACAIHPVQQDVTGIPTTGIVYKIRCEARLAVLDKAVSLLERVAKNQATPAIAAKFEVVIAKLRERRGLPLTVAYFDPRRDLPTPRSKAIYSRYFNTAIAFDFLMQGIENNKAGFTADPLRLINNGVAGVALSAGGDFTRDNLRHFSFADSFGELLTDPKLECTDTAENFIYPVAGRVGLQEVVDTFIDLNEGKQLDDIDSAKTVFADTLKFTTIWTGGATPHVQIDPVGTQWGLAPQATIGLSASRQDIHTLTVGLAMGPPQFVPLSGRGFVFSPRLVGSPSQSNKATASQAAQDLRFRSFIERSVVISR